MKRVAMLQNKPVIVKKQLDKVLLALLGRHELVDLWWNSSNKAFDNSHPLDVYQSNEEDRQKVINYILDAAMR